MKQAGLVFSAQLFLLIFNKVSFTLKYKYAFHDSHKFMAMQKGGFEMNVEVEC